MKCGTCHIDHYLAMFPHLFFDSEHLVVLVSLLNHGNVSNEYFIYFKFHHGGPFQRGARSNCPRCLPLNPVLPSTLTAPHPGLPLFRRPWALQNYQQNN